MSRTAHFRVDPKLAHVLGESYTTSEKALKELVDNAWDANGSQKEEGKMKKNPPTSQPQPVTSSFIIHHSSSFLLPSFQPPTPTSSTSPKPASVN